MSKFDQTPTYESTDVEEQMDLERENWFKKNRTTPRILTGKHLVLTEAALKRIRDNLYRRRAQKLVLGRDTLDKHNNMNLDKTSGAEGKNEGAMSRYPILREEIEVKASLFPLLDYLSTFGVNESHFLRMNTKHPYLLHTSLASAQERLEFLLSIGVKSEDVKKILSRFPQVLQYSVEHLKNHVAYLTSLGILESRIARVITANPLLFSYSVEENLKPTVRYLLDEVGIKYADLSKVVQLSPVILIQPIESSWNARYRFLTKELGAPRDVIVKMVTKHPAFFHYSTENGLLPRINFLRSIGLTNSEILKLSSTAPQVLSLSVEENIKPKYLYMINKLGHEVKSLVKYPTYLYLSLDQRIRPRHRFLVSLKKAPTGPFPINAFFVADEVFCGRWARSSLDAYVAFRQKLLLKSSGSKRGRS